MDQDDRILPVKPSDLTKEQFVQEYGGLYEHSSWVAERIADRINTGTLDTVSGLHEALSKTMLEATHEEQLALVRAHPDLATRAAVTPDSASEQSSVGLNECTPEQFKQFNTLNDMYKAKFAFPFIMAVRGSNRFLILEAFEKRIHNSVEVEFQTALHEINKIALFRIHQRF